MDGLQLCRQIRTLHHGDRSIILVFTGCNQPENLKAVLDAGADDYLTKPSELALLEIRFSIAEQQAEELNKRKKNRSSFG